METHKNIKTLTLIVLGPTFFVLAFLYGSNYFLPIEIIFNRFVIKGESTVMQSVSTIRTLQGQYASKHQGKFAPNFDELIKSVQLDDKFKGESPVVNGYIYKMTVQEPSGTQPSFYSVTADPITDSNSFFTETRHFYFDSTLKTVKVSDANRPANADDPSI